MPGSGRTASEMARDNTKTPMARRSISETGETISGAGLGN